VTFSNDQDNRQWSRIHERNRIATTIGLLPSWAMHNPLSNFMNILLCVIYNLRLLPPCLPRYFPPLLHVMVPVSNEQHFPYFSQWRLQVFFANFATSSFIPKCRTFRELFWCLSGVRLYRNCNSWICQFLRQSLRSLEYGNHLCIVKWMTTPLPHQVMRKI